MRHKILVVDDEKEILRLIEVCLDRAGYEVITATNGCDAINVALAAPPDLVIMDVMMPEIDGFAALKILKEHETTAHIPIIMLTSLDTSKCAQHAQQLGVDFYWTKPFVPVELAALVKRIFEAYVD